eukprot:11530014-Ditylum_brightwellii.AAC.1
MAPKESTLQILRPCNCHCSNFGQKSAPPVASSAPCLQQTCAGDKRLYAAATMISSSSTSISFAPKSSNLCTATSMQRRKRKSKKDK